MNGGPLDPTEFCLATLKLAVGAGVTRTPLPTMDTEAPVTIAIAEPLTAA
jgi:hypothetical protein